MQTPIVLETDSEASAQMLLSQLPAKYQRWRAFLANFESVKVHYVGYKGVASCRAKASGTRQVQAHYCRSPPSTCATQRKTCKT
jgi:hypothetical protein